MHICNAYLCVAVFLKIIAVSHVKPNPVERSHILLI